MGNGGRSYEAALFYFVNLKGFSWHTESKFLKKVEDLKEGSEKIHQERMSLQ